MAYTQVILLVVYNFSSDCIYTVSDSFNHFIENLLHTQSWENTNEKDIMMALKEEREEARGKGSENATF